jgi:MFS family permease
MLSRAASTINLGTRLAPRTPFFYGWIILFTAGSTQVVRNSAASLTIAVFIFPLSEELGWSRTLIAGAASFGGLAASGVSPLVGWLVDRYGARLVLAASIFILGLSTVSLSWATVPVAFYLAYGVGRVIFSSPIQIGSSVLVSRWFVRMRGRASGILFGSHSVGLVLFPLIASVVIGVSGWREAWLVLGILVWAIALLPTTLLVVQQPEDVGLRPDGDDPAGSGQEGQTGVASFGPAASSAPEEPVWTLREAMRTPALWMFAAATGMTFLVQAGVNTHLAAYLRDQGLSAAFAGFGISMNAAVMGVGSIFWGWVTERVPARYVMAGVAFTVGGASGLFVIADSTPEILVYTLLFGFGVGGLLSVPLVVYADYYGRRSLGAIRGVTEPLTTFGQAIGTVLAGLVFDLTDSYNLAFVTFAIMGGLATVLVLFARPPRRPASDEALNKD